MTNNKPTDSESGLVRVKGYINPRYLDAKWFRNFGVSRDIKSEKDIPIIVEFHNDSYKSGMCDNNLFSYQELEQKVTELEAREKKLIELISSYCCCSQMGATGGQCCFCYDLRKTGGIDNGN